MDLILDSQPPFKYCTISSTDFSDDLNYDL